MTKSLEKDGRRPFAATIGSITITATAHCRAAPPARVAGWMLGERSHARRKADAASAIRLEVGRPTEVMLLRSGYMPSLSRLIRHEPSPA